MAAEPDTAALSMPWLHAAAPPRRWERLQDRCVDGIKRAALRHLHASAAGERLVLRIYLVGEEATEIALQRRHLADVPEALARQMEAHLADEQRHARAFAAALAERGAPPCTDGDAFGRPDALSRRKIAHWQRVAERHSGGFTHGLLVPAFAIGLCAEQMASRVLRRHCSVIGTQHALHPLLASVLADEARHVRLCTHTLDRLVAPQEQARLQALLSEVRAIDRSFGIAGALAMLFAGLALRLAPRRARPAVH